MESPIFGFDVVSKWDQLGEIPLVSTFTSVARFTKGALCGVWHVICLSVKGKKGFDAVQQDAKDMGRAICEVIPIVNMFAAYYFNRLEQISKFAKNDTCAIRININCAEHLIEERISVSSNRNTLALWIEALKQKSGEDYNEL